MFQDITLPFLTTYEKYLRQTLGNKTNTVHKDMKFLRKVFNDAYRQDLIEHNQNPFLKYQLKLEKTQRTYLTEDELNLIEINQRHVRIINLEGLKAVAKESGRAKRKTSQE